MELDRIREIIMRTGSSGQPEIELLKRAKRTGPRVGVLASSFNPVTVAHLELMRRAEEQFSLDELVALAGKVNADKTEYECSLEDRLAMLVLTFAEDSSVSVGLSSHAFFVDMADAMERLYQRKTDLYFIVGFDTFERVLDREGKYVRLYYRRFKDRLAALEYLLAHARLIVAGRGGAGGRDVEVLVNQEPARLRERILYLDFPPDLASYSATRVRERVSKGFEIGGLVPPVVESYIQERQLYCQGQ